MYLTPISAAASTAAMAGYTALTAFAEGEAADAAASGYAETDAGDAG